MIKRIPLILTLYVFDLLLFSAKSHAAESKPDTVLTGIYITSIHNIDFKQKEYAITFWVWFKYKNKDFDFNTNIEIPNAKTFSKSFTTDTILDDGRSYVLMKLECIMKDNWKIDKFPFDYQNLRLTIENSQYDTTELVFKVDTVGAHYGAFAINGWKIKEDSVKFSTRNMQYKTAFGDESYAKPYSSYSAFRVKIGIEREASWTLFWKTFIGMYVAFFIAFVCFYVHSESIEARFGLNVGALFAVVGNKYIVDSSLPDSLSPTLVDMLHAITLIFIFCVVAATIYSLRFVKEKQVEKARRFDRIARKILLAVFVAINIYFIAKACM